MNQIRWERMTARPDTSPDQLAPGIRKVTPADLETVIAMFSRGYDADPFINYLVKQDARREKRKRRFMKAGLTRLGLPFGETYMTEGGDGAAIWQPPAGRPHGLRHDLSMLVALVGVSGLGGVTRSISAFATAEKRHPKEPHYYLLAIGVDPYRQGQGIGSSLLAPMIARIDREGIGAYLESSNERNLPLYQRFGFELRDVFDLPKGGPRIWGMWRAPR